MAFVCATQNASDPTQLHPGRACTIEHHSTPQHEVGRGRRARPGPRLRTRPGSGPGRDRGSAFPTVAAPGEAESQGSCRSGCADQTTGLYEGATFQDEFPSPSGPPRPTGWILPFHLPSLGMSFSHPNMPALRTWGQRFVSVFLQRVALGAHRAGGPIQGVAALPFGNSVTLG